MFVVFIYSNCIKRIAFMIRHFNVFFGIIEKKFWSYWRFKNCESNTSFILNGHKESIIEIGDAVSIPLFFHHLNWKVFLISLPKFSTGIFLGSFLYPLLWQNTIKVFGLSIFILSINLSFWTKTCLLMETHCFITLYFNDYKICLNNQPFKSL